jgi:DNA recombination protein RmuC
MEFVIGALAVAVVALGVVVVMMMRRGDGSTVDSDREALEATLESLLLRQQELATQVKTSNDAQIQMNSALSETVTQSQTRLTKELNDRLDKVNDKMGMTLTDSAKKTAESLGDLTQRLVAIDAAQKNIGDLADQVVSLQHVLDDNPARGAFGEVQLADLVESMLPPFAYTSQATLENGKIVDYLIELPHPPGPISVDAKFPLSAYQNMLSAPDAASRAVHAKQLTMDTRKHLKDIFDKYVDQSIDGERSTSETALMFIPSEAVYGELHAHHPKVIEDSHRYKVYLVSPTTLMATLTTVRAILRDVQMREQAGVIQGEVRKLLGDVGRLSTRVASLDKHFGKATDDIKGIKISAGKVESRGVKIDSLELDDPDEIDAAPQDSLPFD